MSQKTVEFHLGNVYRKLGIASRTQLAAVLSGWSATAGPVGRRGNLPDDRAPLIGRDVELARVLHSIGTSALTTLVGPGGVGKTRLALAAGIVAADRFRDGAWLIELGTCRGEREVPVVAAITVGLRTRATSPTAADVAGCIGDRQMLLIVDNCEHVGGAARALVGALLRTCPGVAVLATSRERLDVRGEHPLTVPTLSTDAADQPSDAARMFVEQASGCVLDGFDANRRRKQAIIERICRALGRAAPGDRARRDTSSAG